MTTATIAPAPAVGLVDRVRAGNDKFNEQLRRAMDAAGDPVRWGRLTDQMAAAWPRLDALCRQLVASGYTGCLYPDGEHKCMDPGWFCWVCPMTTRYLI